MSADAFPPPRQRGRGTARRAVEGAQATTLRKSRRHTPTATLLDSFRRAHKATSSLSSFCTDNEATSHAPPPPRFARCASSSGPPPPPSRGRKSGPGAALALFSDPQCQTATRPLITAASPAMTARNCIPAMRLASGSPFTFQESLPRTDGRPCLCFPRRLCSPKREAERRTAHHGCRASMGRRGRGPISGPLAFRRSSAVMRRDSQLGLGRASWNHRMQTGGPSPAPVQRAPRSPARAGRADTQTA